MDFAVLDEQTNAAVHAVLETVHPESIGIFKFDEDPQLGGYSGATSELGSRSARLRLRSLTRYS